jgi:hypothetical protein
VLSALQQDHCCDHRQSPHHAFPESLPEGASPWQAVFADGSTLDASHHRHGNSQRYQIHDLDGDQSLGRKLAFLHRLL